MNRPHSNSWAGHHCVLGAEGERQTAVVQQPGCRLAADLSFAAASEHREVMLSG